MLKDLRHAVRMLMHAKGWTAVVLLSLALGIGANTAIFSAVNGLLIKQIPVKDPDSLVRLRYSGRNDMVTSSSDYGFTARMPDGQNVRTTFSYRDVQAVRRRQPDDERRVRLCALRPRQRRRRRQRRPCDGVHLDAATTTACSGSTRGSGGPSCRRTTSRPLPPVAVISSKFWHTRFATDPAVVGKTVRVNDVIVTIVGVIAAGVHWHSAACRRAPRHLSAAVARAAAEHDSARPGCRSRPTGGCRSWAG